MMEKHEKLIASERAIGMMQGQFGDLIIGTVPARSFKQQNPNSVLTLGINRRFAEMTPMFANSDFDDIHVYDSYDNWPSPQDKIYLENCKYDIVFNPMPKRGAMESCWWKYEHQAGNACSVYGLPYPSDGLQCKLNKWFDVPDYSNYIAFNFVGAFYSGYPNKKSYELHTAQKIVNAVNKMGYKVIVLGDFREPALENAEKQKMGYFDSIKTMLGCRMLVGIDSGLTWAASAYSHPVVACYSSEYYDDRIAAIQPINPNAQYLHAKKISDITIDNIEKMINIVRV